MKILHAGDVPGVAELLRTNGWLEVDETVLSADRAGDGNMNLTLRVTTDRRSVVLKQARPWVEKYQQIAAPIERALVEARFYRQVEKLPEVSAMMPELLGSDSESYTLLLEDLGCGSDLSTLYAPQAPPLEASVLEQLARYLGTLHAGTRGQFTPELANREMRALNHEHIFRVPYQQGNGVDLEQFEAGLTAAAAEVRADEPLLALISELGERYLDDGPCLLHGDFFLGSWLRADRVMVIDPEFCFFGDPEFDVAIAAAHLLLAGQSADQLSIWSKSACVAAVRSLDMRLVAQFAGCEILRRLLGVAQVPVAPSEGSRADLVQCAVSAVKDGHIVGL